jgi:cephalosporin hydroxylase
MIVQDTKLDRILKHAGPRRAVRNFLQNHTNFVSDRSREVFLYSQHTEGYLLRQS